MSSSTSIYASGTHLERGELSRPVRATILAIVLYMVVAKWGPLWLAAGALQLPDNDDTMRLVLIRDFLAGQDWFDMAQHRMLPPDGSLMHWSRLVDLPIAGLMLALDPLLGREGAERLAVQLWPGMLFSAYAALVVAAARHFFGATAGWFALLGAVTAPLIQASFAPGRIDHHGLQMLIVTGAAVAGALPARDGRRSLLAGVLAALSLAIGIETLPLVAMIGAFHAGAWIVHGHGEARRFAAFALGLGCGAPLLYWLQTGGGDRTALRCGALEAPFLTLAVTASLASLALLAACGRWHHVGARLAAATVAGGAVAAIFVVSFPECLASPLASMPKAVVELFHERVSEVMSVFRLWPGDKVLVLALFAPVAAAIPVGLYALLSCAPGERRPLALFLAVLGIGAAVALIYIRGVYIAVGCLPFLVAWTLTHLLTLLSDPARRRAGAVLALACLSLFADPWVLAGTVLPGADDAQQVEANKAGMACESGAALAQLAALPPGVVLAPLNLGPEILLFTPHKILAAPYYNGNGMLAALESFEGTAPADLERNIARYDVTYVAICPSMIPDEPNLVGRRMLGGERMAGLEALPTTGSPIRIWRVVKP